MSFQKRQAQLLPTVHGPEQVTWPQPNCKGGWGVSGRTRRVGKALRRKKKNGANGPRPGAPEEALAFEEWVEGKKPQRRVGGGQRRRGRRVVLEGEAVKAPRWARVPS